MGLKTTNYTSDKLGVTIPEAYALCSIITCSKSGMCEANFEIGLNRESIYQDSYQPLDRKLIRFFANKNDPLWEQAYTAAKEGYFAGWQDDIV